MLKSNIKLSVMADGMDGVIILHNLLEEDGSLNKLYENAGKIADAILVGMTEAEPEANIPEVDTTNEVIDRGMYEGMTPFAVIDKYKDKGYYNLSLLMKDDVSNKLALAINRALYGYITHRFDKVESGEIFAEKLSGTQCKTFLKLFDYAVTERMRKDIAEQVGYDSYRTVVDFAPEQILRVVVEMIVDAYKKKSVTDSPKI